MSLPNRIFMDNFRIDITCYGKEALKKALEIVFMKSVPVGWGVCEKDGAKHFVLYWCVRDSVNPIPFNASNEAHFDLIATMVWYWLEQAEYEQEPDHDGSNIKGWRLFNEAWGHVFNDPYALVAITPEWALVGK